MHANLTVSSLSTDPTVVGTLLLSAPINILINVFRRFITIFILLYMTTLWLIVHEYIS